MYLRSCLVAVRLFFYFLFACSSCFDVHNVGTHPWYHLYPGYCCAVCYLEMVVRYFGSSRSYRLRSGRVARKRRMETRHRELGKFN